jgi:hypothetical protein
MLTSGRPGTEIRGTVLDAPWEVRIVAPTGDGTSFQLQRQADGRVDLLYADGWQTTVGGAFETGTIDGGTACRPADWSNVMVMLRNWQLGVPVPMPAAALEPFGHFLLKLCTSSR